MNKIRYSLYFEHCYVTGEHRSPTAYAMDFLKPYDLGATFLSGHGVWKGKSESCTVAVIYGSEMDDLTIRQLAREIKAHYKQESVLYVAEPVLVYELI